MITKRYHLGKFDSKNELYCIGIQRIGDGTIPFPEETINGVRNNICMRTHSSIEEIRGYLSAVIGEFAFEGSEKDKYFFEFKVVNWNKYSEDLFENYLKDLPLGKIIPLAPRELRGLDNIVGLRIE